MSEFGKRFRAAREAAGYSQEDVSKRTAADGVPPVSRVTIANIEAMKLNPSESIMGRLATAVGFELWRLLKP